MIQISYTDLLLFEYIFHLGMYILLVTGENCGEIVRPLKFHLRVEYGSAAPGVRYRIQ